jgi:hypothetical protein
MASKQIVPYLNVPLSSALFTIDSRDGVRSDPATGYQIVAQNPYDISIYKNQQLFSGAVERVALTEINMPWNIPNVNDYNNVLFLKRNAPEQFASIVVPVGFYTPTALASAIQNLLNYGIAVLPVGPPPPLVGTLGFTTWTCTWSADTNQFTLTMYEIPVPPAPVPPSLVGFFILPKIGQPKGVSNGFQRSSTLAEMMGFNSTSSTVPARQLISSWATMLYTTYVDIVSSILCKHQDVRDTSTNYFTGNNILARVYISPDRYYSVSDTTTIGVKPFQLHYEFPVPKEIQWEPTEFLPSCNIKLQDDKGNALFYLPTGASGGSASIASDIVCGNTAFVQMSMLISEAKP